LSVLEQVLNAQRLELTLEDADRLRALHLLCDWITGHPMVFYINIHLPAIDSQLFYSHSREFRHYHSLHIALTDQLLFF
jgi:hypothetical protein